MIRLLYIPKWFLSFVKETITNYYAINDQRRPNVSNIIRNCFNFRFSDTPFRHKTETKAPVNNSFRDLLLILQGESKDPTVSNTSIQIYILLNRHTLELSKLLGCHQNEIIFDMRVCINPHEQKYIKSKRRI